MDLAKLDRIPKGCNIACKDDGSCCKDAHRKNVGTAILRQTCQTKGAVISTPKTNGWNLKQGLWKGKGKTSTQTTKCEFWGGVDLFVKMDGKMVTPKIILLNDDLVVIFYV